MNAAVYVRISLDKTGQAAGVKRQETDCRNLVKQRGWNLAGVWSDNDKSATDRTKPRDQYLDLLDHVRAGTVEAIVCWHVDRLYRQPRELEDLMELMDDGALPGGIQTVTAGELDLNTASGRMVAGILVNVARAEVDRTRERLKARNRHDAAAGKRTGGPRPFGYEQDGITPRESEATEYRAMVRDLLDGVSIVAITKSLNERGVTTVRGNEWKPSRVRDVLRNPRYGGFRTHHGEITAEAEWPPLVPRKDWERVAAILNDPTRKTTPGPKPKRLLSGLATCGKCGHTLMSRRSNDKRVYGCPGPQHGGCYGITIQAERTEAIVVEWVMEALDDSRLVAALTVDDSTDAGEVMAEIEQLEARMDDLAGEYAAGNLPVRQYAAASKQLTDRLDTARARLQPPGSPLSDPTVLADIRTQWETLGADFQRDLLRLVIDRIEITPAQPGFRRFDPERIVIHPTK